MGKGYVFTGATEDETKRKISRFVLELRRAGYARTINRTGVGYSHAIKRYRGVIDVCGTESGAISFIAQSIEKREDFKEAE